MGYQFVIGRHWEKIIQRSEFEDVESSRRRDNACQLATQFNQNCHRPTFESLAQQFKKSYLSFRGISTNLPSGLKILSLGETFNHKLGRLLSENKYELMQKNLNYSLLKKIRRFITGLCLAFVYHENKDLFSQEWQGYTH